MTTQEKTVVVGLMGTLTDAGGPRVPCHRRQEEWGDMILPFRMEARWRQDGLAGLSLILLLASTGSDLRAQGNSNVPKVTSRSQVSVQYHPYLLASGKRFETDGDERIYGQVTVYSGATMTGAGTTYNLTWEYPDKVRLDGSGTFTSDHDIGSYQKTPSVLQPLVVMLTEETTEAFLAHFNTPVSSERVLAKRAKYTGTALPQNTLVDVVSVTRPSILTANSALERRFYFDSNTGLIQMVEYTDPSTKALVQTVYSGWITVGTEMIPGKAVRSVGGSVTLTLSFSNIRLAATVSDNAFAPVP